MDEYLENMKRATLLLMLVLAFVLSASGEPTRLAIINAQIHTFNSDNRVASAMLIVGDRIEAVGDKTDIERLIGETTQILDLNGATLLPGFIDAHSHFPVSGLLQLAIDLSPPPVGKTASLDMLLERIGSAAEKQAADSWLLGFNYDNTALEGGVHPTRQQLDAVAPNHPVYLWHSSGHMGVANSKALAKLKLNDDSTPGAGGSLGRDDNGSLNGLLQESSAPPLSSLLKDMPMPRLFEVLTLARDEYLAAGVTTLQNGYAGSAMKSILHWAQRLRVLPQRVLLWPAHDKMSEQLLAANPANRNQSEFVVGAVKIMVDGSPQGLTAYFTEPYLVASGAAPGFRGFAALPFEELQKWVSRYHRAGYQLAMHGNGDAAIDEIISAVEVALQNDPRPDARHILVHAQTVRLDQLVRMHSIGMTPSFFTAHTYYWGDWHRFRSLGAVRAENISPAGWAESMGIPYTLHTDAPVTPMLPMQLVWSATQRETVSGHVLGAAQRISTLSALRAITIDAAWQNHLEDSRGSLEPGKLADFVVMSEDPMQAADVRDVHVVQTYIGGRLVYEIPPG